MSYLENGATLQQIERAEDCPLAYPSVEGAECPYPFYSWAREKHPVYQLPGTTYYFLTRYEDVEYVAMHPELFSSVGRTLGTKPEPRPHRALLERMKNPRLDVDNDFRHIGSPSFRRLERLRIRFDPGVRPGRRAAS